VVKRLLGFEPDIWFRNSGIRRKKWKNGKQSAFTITWTSGFAEGWRFTPLFNFSIQIFAAVARDNEIHGIDPGNPNGCAVVQPAENDVLERVQA
jgi:hypothetical protein